MDRLKSGIWVSAHIRLCQARGAFATVVRRGDGDAGAIFVVVRHTPLPPDGTNTARGINSDQVSLFFREYDEQDKLIWRSAYEGVQTEHLVNERLEREIARDADLWILEVEACDGRGFLSPVQE